MISSACSVIVMRRRRVDAIFSIHRSGSAAASRVCVDTAKFAEGALTPGIAYWKYENDV